MSDEPSGYPLEPLRDDLGPNWEEIVIVPLPKEEVAPMPVPLPGMANATRRYISTIVEDSAAGYMLVDELIKRSGLTKAEIAMCQCD